MICFEPAYGQAKSVDAASDAVTLAARTWQGATPATDPSLVEENSKGWTWDAYNNGNGCAVRLDLSGCKWTDGATLKFNLHASQVAPGTIMLLAVISPGANGKGDYYYVKFPVDWEGHKKFSMPLKFFQKSRQPAGWDAITEMVFYSMHGGKPKDPVTLTLSQVQLKEVVVTESYKLHDATRVTPVTMGDAVIEPFWDRNLDAWSQWIVSKDKTAVKAEEVWCMVTLAWTAAAVGDGPVLQRIYTGSGVTLGSYSQLVFSAGFPKGTKITMSAKTDAGKASQNFICEVGYTTQHILQLPSGSTHLQQLEISIGAATPGPVSGNLLWIGVRNPLEMAAEQEKWRMISAQPLDVFLRQEPEFEDATPLCNILCPAAAFQKAKQDATASKTPALGLRSAVALAPHLGVANQNLFGRMENQRPDRVGGTFNTKEGKSMGLLEAAQEAAIANDVPSLREVAKAAVQIALIPHWDVDFITKFPDSSWEQRSFAQAKTCFAMAVAFDLAGGWLSPAGRDLILRRLAEDGLGNINYVVWRHPYIFDCNQLAVFSMGRLAVYSLLEKQSEWRHIQPYTDLAFNELNESLTKILIHDGGFSEGTGYMAYTLNNALPALAIYGNARGKQLCDLLPPLLLKTDDYLEVMRSTEKPAALILVSDAQGGPFVAVNPSVLSVMAKIRPGGTAARMLAVMTREARSNMPLWALPVADITGLDTNFYVPFVRLPETGMASSSRKVENIWSKLLVIGGPANASHSHEDRGSFVLEFAGETFAADPGGVSYSDSMCQTMQYAQNHNMLVPVTTNGIRASAKNPAPVAVVPEANGDATSFNASVNPGVLWPEYYKYWRRSFVSPSPSELTIIDDYEIIKGEAVEFLLHTPLAVTQSAGLVIIQGVHGRIIIIPSESAKIEIIPSRNLGCRKLSTIVFRKNGQKGVLSTSIRLETLNQ